VGVGTTTTAELIGYGAPVPPRPAGIVPPSHLEEEFSLLYLDMLSHREIDEAVTDLWNSVGLSDRLCKGIRELDSAREELRSATDESGLTIDECGERAKKVITKLAFVKRRLVEYTDLRQEQELNVAIELFTAIVIEADCNKATNFQENYSDSD